jgi:DNA-binding Lrp family transcriptional regulator
MQKYRNLKEIAEKNFPHSWEGIEFTLSVLKILNIAECTLPFAGIMLARPGANKTLSSELLTFWLLVYYSRKFTPKAFVSNSTALDKEELADIDMLPRIRFKLLLTPELTPIFSANEDELRENLGIITSVLDGHGLVTDSGAHGRRGYHGNYMFVWVGAAVDIPYRVHKMLATLGPKLYFFRLPYVKKRTQEIIEQLDENFEKKRKEVQWAVIDFLIWHEVNPRVFIDEEETKLPKIRWDSNADDKQAKHYLVNLGELLGRLRGHVDIWSEAKSSFKEHEYSEYSYSFTQTEDPTRATTQLYNITRGHALLEGRNHISLQKDLPIAIKVALSTASIERVAVIDLLLANNGQATLSEIASSFAMSKSTALKTMTELTALKVVDMETTEISYNKTIKIMLKPEFGWLFGEEFKKLRQGFVPVDNSFYVEKGEDEDQEEKTKDLTIREAIVLAEIKKLEEASSPNPFPSDNNNNDSPILKQLLFDTLKADGSFVDDNTINLAIEGLVKKGKLNQTLDGTLLSSSVEE